MPWNETMQQPRKDYLDVAKLLAVSSVIFVHASVTYNPVRRTISCFFMPVFFIIYGMASSGSPIRSWKEVGQFLEKRARSLLVPYVVWALIYAREFGYTLIKGIMVGNNPALSVAKTNAVLGFLPCMFIAVILFQIYINLDDAVTGKPGKMILAVLVMAACGVISCKFSMNFVFGSDIAFSGCLFMIIGRGWAELFETFYKGRFWYVKILSGGILFLCTYLIGNSNLPYLELEGYHGVVMARAVYGRYDLFLAGAVLGSFGLLLIAMLLERVRLLAYMGRFSLLIMAVHYILFSYVKPLCDRVLDMPYGEFVYPAVITIGCLLLCIPLCYIIDWAIPELNGKTIRIHKK